MLTIQRPGRVERHPISGPDGVLVIRRCARYGAVAELPAEPTAALEGGGEWLHVGDLLAPSVILRGQDSLVAIGLGLGITLGTAGEPLLGRERRLFIRPGIRLAVGFRRGCGCGRGGRRMG